MNIFAFFKHLIVDQFLFGMGGGKGGGSAPSPPDPYAVANATTQTNTQTAAYNKALNLNNYSNPFGSQQSQQTGTDPTTGAPIYNTSISANPQLQQALGQALSGAGNSTGINNTALSGLQGLGSQYAGLNTQLAGLGSSLNPQAAQDAQKQGQQAAYSSQTQYLDPQYQQQQSSLESQLANQGLTPGSQAYDNATKNFNLAKQSAYSNAANQSILTGSQLGTQNWQNQIAGIGAQSSLIGQQGANLGQQGANYGQQVGIGQIPYQNLQSLYSLVPGNTGTAQSSASPANIGQNIYSNYQGQLNNYNAGQSSSNSMMGGLFGLGSSALMAYGMSDRRLKTDIEPTGDRLVTGLPVYRFRYVWDAPHVRRTGVMADEVRRVAPEAVEMDPSGFDKVNYDAIGGRHVLALR